MKDILKEEQLRTIGRLSEYLDRNPDAADRADALRAMAEAYAGLEDDDRLMETLERKYDALDKGVQADLNDLMEGTVKPLVEVYKRNRRVSRGLAFVERVREDMENHPRSDAIGGRLRLLSKDLKVLAVGDQPSLSFEGLNGEKVDLAALRGKVVLLDFWATWCPPCTGDVLHLREIYEAVHKKGFEVIGVSLDKTEAELLSFIEENELSWPQFFDGNQWRSAPVEAWGVRSIPATFLIGKDGKVVAVGLKGQELEDRIMELLD